MIADYMQDMFEAEACDGFVLTPTISPLMWEEFARMLTPELQRRGLLRTEYAGATMRENLRSRPWGSVDVGQNRAKPRL